MCIYIYIYSHDFYSYHYYYFLSLLILLLLLLLLFSFLGVCLYSVYIYIYMYVLYNMYIYTYIYICIYIPGYPKRQNFLSIRVWTCFLSVTVFFPNTAMFGFHPSTYRSIAFLKSWIYRTGSDSIVSRLETVFGAVC